MIKEIFCGVAAVGTVLAGAPYAQASPESVPESTPAESMPADAPGSGLLESLNGVIGGLLSGSTLTGPNGILPVGILGD